MCNVSNVRFFVGEGASNVLVSGSFSIRHSSTLDDAQLMVCTSTLYDGAQAFDSLSFHYTFSSANLLNFHFQFRLSQLS